MRRPELPVLAGLVLLAAMPAESTKTAEPIACGALPAAVRAAASKETAKAAAAPSCEKIIEDGRALFEVKLTSNAGKMREMVYNAAGKLEEWEEEIEIQAIPPGARRAIQSAPGMGVLHKVDVIHRGSVTLYEGEYRDGTAKKKLIVDAAGRAISR